MRAAEGRNFFILVTADNFHPGGRRIEAADIAEHRLRLAKWPIYKNTRNRKIMRAGDIVLVYVGGTRRMGGEVIARAIIKEIILPKSGEVQIDLDDAMTPSAEMLLILTVAERFRGVHLRTLIWELSISPKQRIGWGTALMGGARRVSERDVQILLEHVAAPNSS